MNAFEMSSADALVKRTGQLPRLPGANAGNLATNPQMGTDHWTLHRNGARRRNAQIRKPAPTNGTVRDDLMPVARKRTVTGDAPVALALAYPGMSKRAAKRAKRNAA